MNGCCSVNACYIYIEIWNFIYFISKINNKKEKENLIGSNLTLKHSKMNKNLENICRVCLNSGSRNIFEKSSIDSQFSIPAIGENVSSIDRLVEKLRYVTMLKVSLKPNENIKSIFPYISRTHTHTHIYLSHTFHQNSLMLSFFSSKIINVVVGTEEKNSTRREKRRSKQTNKRTHNERKRSEEMKLDQGFALSTFVFMF